MTGLVLEAAISVGPATLTPVVRLVIKGDCVTQACWVRASKVPYALVIRGPDGLSAVDMAGQRLSLPELLEQLPDLRGEGNV